VLKLKCH